MIKVVLALIVVGCALVSLTECQNCGTGCLNGGKCVNISANLWTCACTAGYSGSTCQNPPAVVATTAAATVTPFVNTSACASHPCANGGVCVQISNLGYCACKSGFSGPTCSTVAGTTTPAVFSCTVTPCINGGVCVTTSQGEVCACPNGYTGSICNIAPTTAALTTTTTYPWVSCSLVCNNGGLCVSIAGSAPLCACAQGFTGPDCSVPPATTAVSGSTSPATSSGASSSAATSSGASTSAASTGSTSSGASTSAASTGSTSSGASTSAASTGSTSSGASTSAASTGSTSAASTGSTSAASTGSTSAASTGSTSAASTSTGSTSTGSTSTGSTSASTSTASTSVTSTNAG